MRFAPIIALLEIATGLGLFLVTNVSCGQCGALVRVDFVRARETYLRDL
jgi:hypothetical protein